ncbi:hypothetical protein [Breoghania sp. L-A4]|uniref:hypothetical protein n=1 Tax=Breoghania sp. L-A4 TaxID=2304600 RepID=UPI000E358817|nr:hypothetical protein [Breoghania sp. L-A4]AXS40491.1 hypothetical protein D1F64_10995 [Breoghania sp. L-A4]
MAFLFAVSAFQFRIDDVDLEASYAQIPLPPGGDVTTTANIGTRNGTRGGVPRQRFDIFEASSPESNALSNRMDVELKTLRHEIIALRRSSEAMRHLNEQLSIRVNELEAQAPNAQHTVPSAGISRLPSGVRRSASNDERPASQAPVSSSSAPRSNFGIDLGRYSSLDDVESAWSALKVTESSIIGSLSPLASVYQANGSLSAHLLAGPFPNAADAAKTCARLTARRIACKPTLFVGQQLTAR